MERKTHYKIIMVAKGKRVNAHHYISSCFVRTQMESVRPHVKKVIPFAIDDTTSLTGLIKNAIMLRKLTDKGRPDIIHAQYGSTTALISLLASYKKCPLLISFCGGDLVERPSRFFRKPRRKSAIAISRFCSRYANAIIVKSTNLYLALPKFACRAVYILPNGVDIDHFRPMPKDKARRLLSLDSEHSIVLFNMGKPDAVKYPQLAEAAFSQLKKKMNNVVLQKIGTEPYEKIPLYLNAADVLLVTSLEEGSPNTVKEAMACNLPVVTVKCGDVTDRLERVTPGCITGYDTKMLAESMATILDDKQRSNGRVELLNQELDQGSVAKKLINVYKSVLSR